MGQGMTKKAKYYVPLAGNTVRTHLDFNENIKRGRRGIQYLLIKGSSKKLTAFFEETPC